VGGASYRGNHKRCKWQSPASVAEAAIGLVQPALFKEEVEDVGAAAVLDIFGVAEEQSNIIQIDLIQLLIREFVHILEVNVYKQA
jgi:hypothetical protein